MIFKSFLMFASRGIPAVPSFTMEVKSDNVGTSTDSQFTIPVTAGTYLYDYTTSDGQSGTGLTGATTITFASGAGTYEIYITGTFPRIYFNNGGDKLKLLRVLEWGDYGVGATDQTSAFYGCTNLTSIGSDVTNLNLITTGNNLFRSCPLTSLPSGLTLNNMTSAFATFLSCPLTSLPNGMALTSLENGLSMFNGCNFSDLPAVMTLPALSNGLTMFIGSTINTTRYSQLLVDLESGNANNSVAFHGGSSKYNATGETARNILTGGVRLWTITDGGLEP